MPFVEDNRPFRSMGPVNLHEVTNFVVNFVRNCPDKKGFRSVEEGLRNLPLPIITEHTFGMSGIFDQTGVAKRRV